MLELIRQLSESTHHVIIAGDALSKAILDAERQVVELSAKKAQVEALDKQIADKSALVADLTQKLAELTAAIEAIKAKF